MSEAVIHSAADYSNAVLEISKRTHNLDISLNRLGDDHVVRVHLDRDRKNVVVGVFNRFDKLVVGLQTLR